MKSEDLIYYIVMLASAGYFSNAIVRIFDCHEYVGCGIFIFFAYSTVISTRPKKEEEPKKKRRKKRLSFYLRLGARKPLPLVSENDLNIN